MSESQPLWGKGQSGDVSRDPPKALVSHGHQAGRAETGGHVEEWKPQSRNGDIWIPPDLVLLFLLEPKVAPSLCPTSQWVLWKVVCSAHRLRPSSAYRRAWKGSAAPCSPQQGRAGCQAGTILGDPPRAEPRSRPSSPLPPAHSRLPAPPPPACWRLDLLLIPSLLPGPLPGWAPHPAGQRCCGCPPPFLGARGT